MNNLKKPKQNPVGFYKAGQKYKQSKKTNPRKLRIKQERKRKNEITREDKTGKKVEIVAFPQLEQILLQLQRAKKRTDAMARVLGEIFPR